ncbi:MAG: serine protein kinase [Pseudomonadota bacterium]
MAKGKILSEIAALQDVERFQQLHWSGSLEDYLDIVKEDPRVCRSAYQRVYDMVMSHGYREYMDFKKKVVHYNFFDDDAGGGKDAVFGLDLPMMKLVHVLKAGAYRYGPEKRVLLLHGPVGSAKSSIVRLLKKGLEVYTRSPEGALYTFEWEMPDGEILPCPINEEPLHLVPLAWRSQVTDQLGLDRADYPIVIEKELCPACRYNYNSLLETYGGDWLKVVQHTKVRRFLFSESDRVGIGTFQPKDEKNQDSTELTGDINYRKIAIYGSDSDPRAFNFDGEFCVANRGLIEFVEVLKLDVAFLYDLLGASQEHKIKPKKFAQTDIDEVIIGHTNEPEYRKLQNNEYMEALRDRTIKIDIPYITRVEHEQKIYDKEFGPARVGEAIHIAPHTMEVAALWSVLTRLEHPKKHGITLLQKAKLYDGKLLPGFTEDNVKELRKETEREGLEGISPRYVQDKLSNALASEVGGTMINPFIVLNELESGLKHHGLIASEDLRTHYRELLAVVREEYEEILKNEVQRAISADEDAIDRLCANYIDNVKAYTQKERVRNRYTGQDEEPDDRLMRSIEEKIDIPENRADDFRKEIMNFIGARALEGKTFDFRTNERLRKALELKLFEDQKDSIKLASLVSSVVDRKTQEKIDIVKNRLIRNFGYNDESATDVLNYVASIFARGDTKSSS